MKCCTKSSSTDKRGAFIIIICVSVFIVSAVLSLCLGSTAISLEKLWSGLFEGETSSVGRILLHVRFPRLFAAALSGTGLAVSGVVIQTVLNNPLASPGIIGVNAGAGFMTAMCGVLFPRAVTFIPLAAFIGALTAVLFVYGIAKKAGASKMTLILSGVAVGSLMTAGINTVTTLIPDALSGMHAFQTGGFAGVTTRILIPAGAFIIIATAAVIAFGGELEVLGLGESVT